MKKNDKKVYELKVYPNNYYYYSLRNVPLFIYFIVRALAKALKKTDLLREYIKKKN